MICRRGRQTEVLRSAGLHALRLSRHLIQSAPEPKAFVSILFNLALNVAPAHQMRGAIPANGWMPMKGGAMGFNIGDGRTPVDYSILVQKSKLALG